MNRLVLFLMVATVGTFAFAEKPLSGRLGVSDTRPESGVFVEVDGRYLLPYTAKIPGTDVTFEMVPIPGGTFLLGSPDGEADRDSSEGPQVTVKVAPMWVGKHEVKWDEYDEFMGLYEVFTKFEANNDRTVDDTNSVDAVTAPTPLHEPTHTFEHGHEPRQAAVSMTQYAAQQYTKWLSAITGEQYRLPTEAEWEYACRGGSSSAFYWGDEPGNAEDHAWFYDNAGDDGQRPVGEKQANPFGLYDMLGNAAEWTVNSFTDDGYERFAAQQPIDALRVVVWPKELATSSVIRGGMWQSYIEEIRCAARMVSDDESWKDADPNFPLSPWWFTTDPARGVGFRLFRSYDALDEEQIRKFWDNMAEDTAIYVDNRLNSDGKGKLGLVDRSLPAAIEKLSKSE